MDPNPSIIKFLLQYQQTRHSAADIAHHQPYGSHAALSSESQFLSQWQNLSLDETPNFQSRQDLMAMDEIKHHFSLADLQKHSEGQPYLSTGKGNQQPNKQVPFGMLLPILQSQLDDNRAMQLQTLYFKLMKNEISKDGFVRHIRSIVGDQMLKMAVYKLQTQAAWNSRTATPNQMQLPSKL